MSGKIVEPSGSFQNMFEMQQEFQKHVTGLETPMDSLKWYVYHMNAMQEELGEVLKSDKRWKTHRNTNYDPKNKLEELADVFITAMNIGMYSGFSAQELEQAILSKIVENSAKFAASNRKKESYRNDNNRRRFK